MTEPMFETHTPISVTPSAIAEALANYQPTTPKPEQNNEIARLRRALRATRHERDAYKHMANRRKKKLNQLKELLNA